MLQKKPSKRGGLAYKHNNNRELQMKETIPVNIPAPKDCHNVNSSVLTALFFLNHVFMFYVYILCFFMFLFFVCVIFGFSAVIFIFFGIIQTMAQTQEKIAFFVNEFHFKYFTQK